MFQCSTILGKKYHVLSKQFISCQVWDFKKNTFKRVLTKTCHFELKHHKSIKFQNVKVKQCEVHLPSKFALESCDNILKY